MITGNDLPKNIILVQEENSRICLFDYQYNVPVAFATVGRREDITYISHIVAEKGYGPLIADIAMMLNYPVYLASSLEIKPGAQTLYKFYDKNRPDVEQAPLPEDEIEYRKTLSLTHDLPELRLDFLLKMYRKSPESWLKTLLTYSQEIISKYDYLDVNEILDKGYKYMEAKY